MRASSAGTAKICWKARTSSCVTTPSAFAILADSAIMAIEKATLRRSCGSPAKNVRTASTTSKHAEAGRGCARDQLADAKPDRHGACFNPKQLRLARQRMVPFRKPSIWPKRIPRRLWPNQLFQRADESIEIAGSESISRETLAAARAGRRGDFRGTSQRSGSRPHWRHRKGRSPGPFPTDEMARNYWAGAAG